MLEILGKTNLISWEAPVCVSVLRHHGGTGHHRIDSDRSGGRPIWASTLRAAQPCS